MSHISIVFLVDINFNFLPELSADQRWILNESLKLSTLRIITGYLKTCKSLEWGWKFFNSQTVSTQLDRRSLDAFSGLDSFDKELESCLKQKTPKKQASKGYLQRIDTTIRQTIADFQLDQLATDAKETPSDSSFEIWTITPLPTHSLELYNALMNDSTMYEDDEVPTAKQIQVRTQKRLNQLFVDDNGLSSLLSKHNITAHFIDSRHILPGSFEINFGPGDEFDASKMVQDHKGLALFKSVVAGMKGHVVPIEVMQYGSRLLPVLEALVHDTSKDHVWEGKFMHDDQTLNENVTVMALADELSEDLRGQWTVKEPAKSTAKSTAKKSRAKKTEATTALEFKGMAKQTSVGADWVTREQLLCSFENVSDEDPLLVHILNALHQRACIVAEVTGVETPFMVVLRPVTPLLAIVQPVLDKFKSQVTKACNQKQTKVTLETDKSELKKRVDYFAKLSTKHVTALSEKSKTDKHENDDVDDILHGTTKLAKSTSKIVQLTPQQHGTKSSKALLKEMSDNATNDQMVFDFPAFKDLKVFLTSNFERFSTDSSVSHVERQLSACIRHAVAKKGVKEVTKIVKSHLFRSLEDLTKQYNGEDVDVQNKTRVYLLQTILRFELNTSLLGKEDTESSMEDLIVSKETRKEIKTLLQSVSAIMDFTQRGSFGTFMDEVLCPLYSSTLPYTLIKLYKSFWLPLAMNLQELVPEEEEDEPLVGTVKGSKSKAKDDKKKTHKASAFAKIVTTTSDIGRSSSPVKSDDKIAVPKSVPAKPTPVPQVKEAPKPKPDIVVPPQASSADLIALNNSLQQFQRSSVVGRRYGTNIKQVTVTYKVNNDDASNEKKRKRDPDSNDDVDREVKRSKTK